MRIRIHCVCKSAREKPNRNKTNCCDNSYWQHEWNLHPFWCDCCQMLNKNLMWFSSFQYKSHCMYNIRAHGFRLVFVDRRRSACEHLQFVSLLFELIISLFARYKYIAWKKKKKKKWKVNRNLLPSVNVADSKRSH